MRTYKDYIGQDKLKAKFGIKYLDDNFTGILEDDFWLIGARSGAGKSTIADIIAQYNASAGKRITLITLENFEGDLETQKAYYAYKAITKDYSFTLRDFKAGQFKQDKDALNKAFEIAFKTYEKINIVYNNGDYKIEDLHEDIIKAANNTQSDLLIIDHLDYLDKDNPTESELTHITKLVKEIRDTQRVNHIPIIGISHLRKPPTVGKQADIVVPSVDEFIGSSNKYKQATGAILLAPDDEENFNAQNSLKSTWCCVRKLRMGGVDNKAAKILFDTKTGQYKDEYQLYSVNYAGTKVNKLYTPRKLIEYTDYTSN